jgi:protein SCO1
VGVVHQGERRALIRRRWFVACSAAAAVAGIAVGAAFHGRFFGSAPAAAPLNTPLLNGSATWPAGRRPAPGFSLVDQQGRTVSLASLRGRTAVVTFLDAGCTGACPVEARLLDAALAEVGPRLRPRLVVVSVDPSGDTPARVARALRTWGLPAGTLWVRGPRAQLRHVWDAYHISVQDVGGRLVHSTAVYVLDRGGDERAGSLLPFIPGLLAGDLRRLAREP